MLNIPEAYLQNAKTQRKAQHHIHRIITALSLVVVLGVSWGLKLTGITMAGEAFCGYEEHAHGEECSVKNLICSQEPREAHTHTEECWQTAYICGQEEIQPHIHAEDCYGSVEICGQTACGGHHHADACHEEVAACGLEENEGHIHDENCLVAVIICGQEQREAHAHGDDCYEESLLCGLEENDEHTHDENCWGAALTCEAEETEGHIHQEDCYSQEIGCGMEEQEPHSHEEGCMVTELTCGLEECPLHLHTQDCYGLEAICGLEESDTHVHVDACMAEVLLCEETACTGHFHGEGCYETQLVCAQEETEGHIHTAECMSEELALTCGLEETQGHTHSETCYEIQAVCEKQEHIHVESCYSDLNADIETSDDWEMTFADMTRGPTVKENVVLVAQSQLGYGESTRNFQVDESGTRRGITRYGQWYGNPYGDWSAMFVSFCLHYAGAEEVPANAGPEAMRLEWEKEGLYASAESAIPEKGNLVFLDKTEDESQTANAVAILTSIDEENITVIEGDLDNTVAETQYPLGSAGILGYGLVPAGEPLLLLAAAETCTVWLDGTDGGLGSLTGSPNTAYTVNAGEIMTLPTEWTSPSRYSYTLRGWYDVTNSRYYLPGEEMEVTADAVLYADWVAATYDLGRYNAAVANTVSTADFITTHVFDYNYLFNAQSANAEVTVDADEHSETWTMVTGGTVAWQEQETLNFAFIDGTNGLLDKPNGREAHNSYPGNKVTSGIYSDSRASALFDASDALGKSYLGTGDHLFQIMTDATDEFYGYYYYDSRRNAASYNQSQGRFYVYEYLEGTTASIGDTNSSFLPLNSPYANANGNNTGAYTYDGLSGEYAGISHYEFTSKATADRVLTNFAFGMRMEVDFYLPDDPGSGGNQDIHGNDMHFHFSGDDDVWVLIDGVLVLDIGGIHGVLEGDIDFSSGAITVAGSSAGNLSNYGIAAGEHTMTVMYLERGASQSNCSIYFNLAPRYGLDIRKEDVLTQEVLNGAEFSVYTDAECTTAATLYTSEAAYKQGEEPRNTFTVIQGVAHMWGFSPGKTYYIKETKEPDTDGYGLPEGVIQLTIDKDGVATYNVEIADASAGFTVHGVSISEQERMVYIVVTNAPEDVIETTTVQVLKKWEDDESHSGDYITAYLKVTDPDGTVRRIREIILSDENDWTYTWTNLPKYDYEALAEVQYGIEESYESGYYSTVRRITEIDLSKTEWGEAASFIDGESYLLKTDSGYLSTTSTSDAKLKWVDEETAQNSSLALWTATVSSGKVKLTNGAGQILSFNNSGNNRYFYATTGSASVQSFAADSTSSGFRLSVTISSGWWGSSTYYMYTLNASTGRINTTTSSSSGLILTPMEKITTEDIQPVQDWAYQITNTPLDAGNETAVSVSKVWNIPAGYDSTFYQEYSVTVRLLANGISTGRTVTLNLKNGWQGSFLGLPYTDDNGNVITYTVAELWEADKWTTSYGEVIASGGSPPTYSVEITNTYHAGGPELPSTGTAARLMYVLCGWAIMLGTLVYGIGSRRKRERRMK